MAWGIVVLLWLLALAGAWLAFRRGRLRSPWHLDIAMVGLLAVATLGFFWRVVTGQNWMPADGGDLASFLYPAYRFAAASIRDGAWPLWNSHLYAGAPHVADIQAGFLYPPNLVLFLLSPEFPYRAMQALSMGHVWFAGAGMYLLLARGLRLRRVPALAGALAFMFSDAFIVHFGNLNFNAVASWLPWVFWAYVSSLDAVAEGAPAEPGQASSLAGRRYERVARLWRAALPGILLGIATLAGHIQSTLFILLALAVYSVLYVFLRRRDLSADRRSLAALVHWAVTAIVASLLAAPVLLPALQLSGFTARAAWNYTEAAGYSLSPAQWIGWLIPGFFGRGPQFHWGAWPRVEVGYLGILPLILAGLALALRPDRRTWAWLGLAGASFVLALGIYAIPHGWLTLLPGFGQLRAPARLVLVTDFALAALAAIGLDAVLGPLDIRRRQALDRVWRLVAWTTAAVLMVVVPLAYLSLLLSQGRDEAIVLRISITLIAVVAFAGLLVASLLWLSARRGHWAGPVVLGWLAVGLIMLDLASTGAYQDLGDRDPSQGFSQPAIAGFLAAQPGRFRIDTRTGMDLDWQPDTSLLYGFDDVGGLINPLILSDVTRYWEGLGSRSSRLYDLLNARYVIARKDVELDWSKFALAFDGDARLNVYLNRQALPSAFVVGEVQPAVDAEAAWAAIHAPGFDPARTAVVQGALPLNGGRGQVTDVQSSPGRVVVRATADTGAMLVVSQVWYPGWQAWVDGAPVGAPLRTDFLFQGVLLPGGSHQVELRFLPPLWGLGWLLAGLTLLAFLVLGGVALVHRIAAWRAA